MERGGRKGKGGKGRGKHKKQWEGRESKGDKSPQRKLKVRLWS